MFCGGLNVATAVARRFCRDARGNVAVMFAFAIVPVLTATGVAIDYGRAASLRSHLQGVADATALMIAKDAPDLTASQIEEKARKYFLANLGQTEGKAISVKTTYTPNTGNGSTIVVSATGQIDNAFGKFLSSEMSNVATESTATWGSARMRVALALDVTGSMADHGKIDALKQAVTKFITDMSVQSKNKGDVLISIVPFSKNVNVGVENKNANWITFNDWDETGGYCTGQYGAYIKRKSDCNKVHYTWTAYDKKEWQGCVMDRDQPHDVTSVKPQSNATDYPAEYYPECPVKMMGMSSDWTALKAKVAELSPTGNTNQPIGMAMAWQTLLTTSPWPAPKKDSDASYIDAIIHLSDGANTQNRFSSNVNDINARQAILCDNIKKSGVTLYMVQVETNGGPTQSVMQNCATSSDKFYMLTSGSQTVATFSDIGKKLSALRISK